MANAEHLKILKQGVDIWNKWRDEHSDVKTDFTGVNLVGVNLSRANLSLSDFSGANLSKAKLTLADLSEAKLALADLSEANLKESSLVEADLMRANLSRAELNGAYLFGADLTLANLKGTDFTKANIGYTIFGDNNLSVAIGLDKIYSKFPSTIGISTVNNSKGKLSTEFLRGCGLSDMDIEYTKLFNPDLGNQEIDEILYRIHDLRATQPLQVSPLFISYSHADSAFVDKIESHLNVKGIRFWRDLYHATVGRLEKQIDRAIRHNPTVLLVLSENSIKSDWVEHEVRTARELEKETKRDVLCPVALDDSWKASPWPKRVMEQVMEYNILDFSEWKDDAEFRKLFKKLIEGLELFYK